VTPAAPPVDGGCLCGAVRYRLSGPTFDAGYCHCAMCRKASGAPAVAWASVSKDDFALIAGEPRRYRSSPRVERLHCGTCGAQLLFDDLDEPGSIDVAVATLDDPAGTPPTFHIYDADRIPGFDAGGGLPRHAQGRKER
jgi:hypothetical protein